ncbi:DUF2269 domain-containing protein [Pseudogracilibacillus sp. SO30301A]|uniref:DUF2269 domain-containing protein n=1 Tax=Pseudogracilibacillus sp. SO30301A TaxID=3098291 RepID=UPI00300E5F3C
MIEIIIIGAITFTIIALVFLLVFFGTKKEGKLKFNEKKWWIIAHVFFVILYFAGLLGELMMAIGTTQSFSDEQIYAAHTFILFFDNFLIIPGGFGCLITGVWIAVRTNWGFANYYWIIMKWVGNILAILLGSTIIGLRIHNTFPRLFSVDLHPLENQAYLDNRFMMFGGIIVCLCILIFLVVISYLKPKGKRKSDQRLRKSS